MDKTGQILEQILRKIADKDGHQDLQKAADTLVHHQWEEVIGVRATFYDELGVLLRSRPLDLEAIAQAINEKGTTILGGFSGFRAQTKDFLQHRKARKLVDNLLGDRTKPPGADEIGTLVTR
jgi:hypothetical protein